MRKDKFQEWLRCEGKLRDRPIVDALSRASRIERALGVDLDFEYVRDKGCSVLEQLSYTVKDETELKEVPQSFGFKNGANLRNATV